MDEKLVETLQNFVWTSGQVSINKEDFIDVSKVNDEILKKTRFYLGLMVTFGRFTISGIGMYDS